MAHLPNRIMLMVQQLHERGYTSIYLYSGLSPSGMSWRYSIGQITDGRWPVYPNIISDSVSKEGNTVWAERNSTVELLTDGFEAYFKDQLLVIGRPSTYSIWYAKLLTELEPDEALVFFADYGGKHQELLKTAPGYKKL